MVTFKKKLFCAHYLDNFVSQILHNFFHLLIGLGETMTCIHVGLKVKVTGVIFIKKMSPLIFMRTMYHRAIIFHVKQIGLDEDMIYIEFGFTRLKIKM